MQLENQSLIVANGTMDKPQSMLILSDNQELKDFIIGLTGKNNFNLYSDLAELKKEATVPEIVLLDCHFFTSRSFDLEALLAYKFKFSMYILCDSSKDTHKILNHPKLIIDGIIDLNWDMETISHAITGIKKRIDAVRFRTSSFKYDHEQLNTIVEQRTSKIEQQAEKLSESQKALIYLVEDVNESRDELKRANLDLESLNKELESFSYSVSHDLRAPLNRINGFSRALTEQYWDQLDERGQHYLERIKVSSVLMTNLINEMLNLSRITKKEVRKEEINISKISKLVVHDVLRDRDIKNMEVVIAPDLKANGDKTLITFLLENLISNAIKFSQHKDNKYLEIGSINQNDKEVFFVKDKGAGFSMKYYDQLFSIFQRLHPEDKFEGTGIGLATVQRIINKHGGSIWAEGEVNKGATFFFHL